MGMWGTLIGGALGFTFGGPLGALLGAAIGSGVGGGGARDPGPLGAAPRPRPQQTHRP